MARQFLLNNMTLFQEKYRVESSRLKSRNYTENGWYFITICTKDRNCVFGEIRNGIMGLSDIGILVVNCWQKIEYIRYYIILDKWIVMPNHIHGVIRIERNDMIDSINQQTSDSVANTTVETSHWDVSTISTTKTSRLHSHSIGSIIGQFKSVCTKHIHAMGCDNFEWQTRFYDHVIRNQKSLNCIRKYIRNNPRKWERDRNNPDFL